MLAGETGCCQFTKQCFALTACEDQLRFSFEQATLRYGISCFGQAGNNFLQQLGIEVGLQELQLQILEILADDFGKNLAGLNGLAAICEHSCQCSAQLCGGYGACRRRDFDHPIHSQYGLQRNLFNR